MLAESFVAVSRNQNYTPQFLQYKIRTERRPVSFNGPNADEQSYNSPFKMEELKAALKMTHNSSPGLDRITYSVIKAVHETMLTLILDTFNKIYVEQKFPNNWRTSIIIPIANQTKIFIIPRTTDQSH